VLASFKLVLAAFWDAFSCTVDTMHSTHKDTLITSYTCGQAPQVAATMQANETRACWPHGVGRHPLCSVWRVQCMCMSRHATLHIAIDENFIIFLICEEQCHCSMKAVRHGGSQGMGR
jgi:hypothetical protein